MAAPGYALTWDDGVFRMLGPSGESWANGVLFSDLAERAADLDAVIARQIAFFAAHEHAFEWKLFGHDQPPQLADPLRAAGFVADDEETLVAYDVARPFASVARPADIEFVRLDDPADFSSIADIKGDVYRDAEHAAWLVRSLQEEHQSAPDSLSVHVARSAGDVVAAAWVRFPKGSRFASLWGGATRSDQRRKGIYTTLVGRRLDEARERGYRWLTVDCSADSLPILEKRGFRRLSTTTPWIWHPPR